MEPICTTYTIRIEQKKKKEYVSRGNSFRFMFLGVYVLYLSARHIYPENILTLDFVVTIKAYRLVYMSKTPYDGNSYNVHCVYIKKSGLANNAPDYNLSRETNQFSTRIYSPKAHFQKKGARKLKIYYFRNYFQLVNGDLFTSDGSQELRWAFYITNFSHKNNFSLPEKWDFIYQTI